jgi:hypothetical protein
MTDQHFNNILYNLNNKVNHFSGIKEKKQVNIWLMFIIFIIIIPIIVSSVLYIINPDFIIDKKNIKKNNIKYSRLILFSFVLSCLLNIIIYVSFF